MISSVANLRFLAVISLGVSSDLLEVQEFLNHGVRAVRLFRCAEEPWTLAQLQEKLALQEEYPEVPEHLILKSMEPWTLAQLEEKLALQEEYPEHLVLKYMELTKKIVLGIIPHKAGPALQERDIPEYLVSEYQDLRQQDRRLESIIPDIYYQQGVCSTSVPESVQPIYTALRLWRRAYREWANKDPKRLSRQETLIKLRAPKQQNERGAQRLERTGDASSDASTDCSRCSSPTSDEASLFDDEIPPQLHHQEVQEVCPGRFRGRVPPPSINSSRGCSGYPNQEGGPDSR
jgi:hypothetical protein